ncbi:hypothetical protein KGD82_27675 (plasmid) [Nocardiopsis eucommiae]|uniref:Uncharacterized protein n=1 Tax=Nocardiopsis eucommiae TaxID=2831970 RepID=A0A975QMC6_9ACTN|nr:hypothetical protein KGD82_27675 [Nocardiopsis eucommiae]
MIKPTAPELAGDQLIGVNEMAEIGGITASTLRAYLTREENDVPLPQATIAGRAMWARPVAQDWAEQRSREEVASVLAHQGTDPALSVGQHRIQERFAQSFTSQLWSSPQRRKRWALRHRNVEQVRQTSQDLARTVAVSLREIVPLPQLATVVRLAVIAEFTEDVNEGKPIRKGSLHLWPATAKMLDWIIRHEPSAAQRLIGEIVRESREKLDIAPDVVGYGLVQALGLDGSLDREVVHAFLERSLPRVRSKPDRRLKAAVGPATTGCGANWRVQEAERSEAETAWGAPSQTTSGVPGKRSSP